MGMVRTFDNSVVPRVQQANDIVDVIGEHVALKRKGREMVGLCPFHEDHRPSMNVNPTKQIFKCFACGAGGDVFKFIQMRENLSFAQALRRLAERAGIKLEPPRGQEAARPAQDDVDPNEIARVNAWAAKYFHNNLADNQKGRAARQYLGERGISAESIEKWQLGLAVDSCDNLLRTARAAKLADRMLMSAGLTTGQPPNLQDRFVNRLMFTITDVTGRVIGFGGRVLAGDGAKYINSPATVLFDKSNALYGLQHARHEIVSSGCAVVVEGYTDCIMAHQFGVGTVVATLGTSFTTGHVRILRRYAKRIVLIFDSDTAGIEAANRALQVALAGRIDIGIATVPTGKDPCDYLLAEGKEPFVKLIDNATDVFAFKWNRLVESFKADRTMVGRKQAVEEYLETVATGLAAGNLSPIETGLIVNSVGRIIAMDADGLNAELRRRVERIKRTSGGSAAVLENRKVTAGEPGGGLSASAQREILEVLLNEPAMLQSAEPRITEELFDEPALQGVARVVLETLSRKADAELKDILGCTEDVELGGLITDLAQAGEQKGNFSQRFKDALQVLQQIHSRTAAAEIKAVEDQTQFIKRVCESTPKRNPHTLGLT